MLPIVLQHDWFEKVINISCGENHTIVASKQHVWTWGANARGQCTGKTKTFGVFKVNLYPYPITAILTKNKGQDCVRKLRSMQKSLKKKFSKKNYHFGGS